MRFFNVMLLDLSPALNKNAYRAINLKCLKINYFRKLSRVRSGQTFTDATEQSRHNIVTGLTESNSGQK